MALVLAIEPDPRQAATLKRVVRAAVRAKLLVVDSKDAALAAIGACVPDLILVTALLPPRDEDDLTRHLKTLEHAGHLQTLTIPMFGGATSDEKLGGRLFGSLRRKKRAPAIHGCDPKVFGEQIEAYLQRAAELREEQRAFAEAAAQPAVVDAEQSPVEQAFDPAFIDLPAGIEGSPVEQDLTPAASGEISAPSTASVDLGFSPAVAEQAPILEQDVGRVLDAPALPCIVEEPPVEQAFSPAVAAAPDSIEESPVEQQFTPADPIEHDFSAPFAAPVEEGFSPAVAEHAPIVEQEVGRVLAAPAQPSIIEEPAVQQAFGPAVAEAPPIAEECAPPDSVLAAHAAAELEADDVDDDGEWQVVSLDEPVSDRSDADMTVAEPASEQQQDTIEQALHAQAEDVPAEADLFVLTAPTETSIAPEPGEPVPQATALSAEAEGGCEQLALEPGGDNAPVEQTAAPIEVVQAEVVAEPAVSAADRPVSNETSSLVREASDVVHTAFAHALGNLHAFVARMGSGLKSRGSAPIPDVGRTDEGVGARDTAAPQAESTAVEPPPVTPLAVTADQQATDIGMADRLIAPEPVASAASDAAEGEASPETDAAVRIAVPPNGDRQPAPAAENRTADEMKDSAQAGGTDSPPSEEIDTTAEADSRKKRRRRRPQATRPVPDLEMALAGVESRWLASAIAALRVDIQQLRKETRTVAAVTTALGQSADAARVRHEPAVQDHHASGSADENGNGNGNGKSNGKGCGQAEAAKPEPAPVQDEWGFYNPERCGMQALMAKLEESDAATANQASGAANQASDSVNRASGGAHQAAAEPNWQEFAAGDQEAGAGPASRGAQAPPRSADLKRLAPLAMWARADEEIEYRIEDILPDEALAFASTPTAELRLSEEVAAVRYGSGARIRRVRVAPGPEPRAKDTDRRVVILSKKALDKLR